jgi:cyclic pyranopterin phosphate synthase
LTGQVGLLSVRRPRYQSLITNQKSYHNTTPLRGLRARSGTLYCMSKLSHFDDAGEARMVDVSGKASTRREAEASVFVAVSAEALAALPNNPKGNPLEVARIAGIQAAKRTSDLIPMCHPLPLTHVDVRTEVLPSGIAIRATAATTAPTGVEMEAMTAAAIAALTVYDMCKAIDKSIAIQNLVLERKTGGKSGDYQRGNQR